jgi:DHA2 family multidrug resistance protein
MAEAAPASAAQAAESYSKYNPWLTAVVATLPTFMEVLNTSIANVTLPHISGSLSAGIEDSTWVLTSYLIANAIVMPMTGWLSAIIGRRNLYVLCVIGFTLASILCGLATSLPMLVFFRLLQGFAGGGLQPITQAILVDTFPVRQRAQGMAVYGMTVVVAPVVGPILGGWIAENYSWRWIFLLNVPIGAISGALAWWLIADPPYLKRQNLVRVDWLSLALLSGWLGCMQMVFDLGQRYDWFASDAIFNMALVSAACGVTFLVRQWHHPQPIVNLRLLLERNFGLSTLIMALFGFMLYATTVVLPLFMQEVLDYTSSRSGMALAPGGLVIMVMMPLVGNVGQRLDVRWMIAAGFFVTGLSLWLMSGFTLDVTYGGIAYARAVQGFGLALTFVPINTLAYAFVDKRMRNEASALISLARNVGAGIGIAVSTTMIARATDAHRTYLVEHATPYSTAWTTALHQAAGASAAHSGDAVAGALAARIQLSHLVDLHASMLSYIDQFGFLALGVLLMIPPVLLMRRPQAPAPLAKSPS